MILSDLHTDLGQYLFKNCPLPKYYEDREMIEEIANAYCIREKIKLARIEDYEFGIVVVVAGTPTLALYDNWHLSFAEQGWDTPMIDFEDCDIVSERKE